VHLPIRRKLLVMVLLPLLGVLPLLGALMLWWGNEALDRLLVTKVRADLAVAHGYFERVLGEVGAGTAAVADSHALQQHLQHGSAAGAESARADLLETFRVRQGLDFLQLLPPQVAAPAPPGMAALARTSVEVLEPAQQALLSPVLRQRVRVPLLPTRNAAPTQRTQEDRALVLLSTHPVFSPDGRLLGMLQGGILLNRNLAFIDHINAIVYPDGSLPFGSQGTATLFLDDVRISTNVRLFTGSDAEAYSAAPSHGGDGASTPDNRAIGTRVSQAVRDDVLGRGNTWLGRAFVVNEWYVSGYLPLASGSGQALGMLYVGFTERPFALLKYALLASIGVVFFAVMIVAAVVSLRWAGTIFRPLELMEATMQRFEAGEAAARVGALQGGQDTSEIGRLAMHLDQLLQRVADDTRALQVLNTALDAKVAERTRQLAEAQAHLVKNEKLAAVGQLTASIAHEINNPIAVIQGNLDLLRALLDPAQAQQVATELNLVDAQIERMRLIVTQLLQFARPTEFAGYVDAVDPARVLDDCLVLVGHLLVRTQIAVQRQDTATRTAAINRQELQQVLVNLLVNAIHAMPDGGTLLLRTRDWQAGSGAAGVEINVADTGPGLPDDVLAQLFQPFVTRKKDGTGLGLWISRSLVERYGGEIVGCNRGRGAGIGHVATGAEFSVRLLSELPAAPTPLR
jgi:signal transduction histidine kinase